MDISTGGSALVHLACHVPFTGGTYGILVYLLLAAIPTSGYRAGFYRQQVLRRGNAEKMSLRDYTMGSVMTLRAWWPVEQFEAVILARIFFK